MEVWNSSDFSLLRTIIPKYTHHHLASIGTYSRDTKFSLRLRTNRQSIQTMMSWQNINTYHLPLPPDTLVSLLRYSIITPFKPYSRATIKQCLLRAWQWAIGAVRATSIWPWKINVNPEHKQKCKTFNCLTKTNTSANFYWLSERGWKQRHLSVELSGKRSTFRFYVT